jgi:uroporphyrinogen decarboxylase
MMTSRERVTLACNFKEPDMVPIGLGSTRSTSFHVDAYAELVRHLGLGLEPVRVFDVALMKGHVDMEMIQWMHADVIHLESIINCWDIPNEDWKFFVTNNGNRILVPGGFNPVVDEKGYYNIYSKNEKLISHMSPTGLYFDSVFPTSMSDDIVHMDPEDFVVNLPMLKDEHLRLLEIRAKSLYENTEYALHGNFVMYDLFNFNIGNHTFSDWLILLATEPDYCTSHIQAITDWTIKNLKMYLEATGKYLHSILVSCADYGGQRGELFSPDIFHELYTPAYMKICDYVHTHSNVKTMAHCCGSIVKTIPHMIEAGIDILNPIQTSAAEMDPVVLKEKFGKKIVFWGGGMDLQKVLPFGTPEEIKNHVKYHMEVLGKGGGYVFTANHNVQPNVPMENMMAMLEAMKEYRHIY